jgi:hypothetical protein
MELIMGGLRGLFGVKSSQDLAPRQPWQLMITLKSMHKKDRAISCLSDLSPIEAGQGLKKVW